MRTTSFAKVAALCGLLALSGCASKITQPDKYSGFLNNYSDLKETTSATGKPVLRWVDPSFDQSKYDSIVWNPITYYPVPKPSTQVGQKVLDKILNYTNTEMKEAIAQRKPLVTTAGPRSLIFRGAITGMMAALPVSWIQMLAGLALLSTIGGSLYQALHNERERDAAVVAFLVTASGLTLFGIGSAFWGLIAGGVCYVVLNLIANRNR
ncbi:DUF3313 domain-containing protein [Escherichia coli]|uniref:DUF3313 domain-containing protein n=2 Tax=Escherichia coli TaxID=562 RepID=UPI0009302203|nr:DUF3313 domain-containing protein [Escherichia coli]